MTPKTTLHTGSALDVLRTLPDNSCDSLVTDPPAGIAFMGRDWDADKGGRKQWVAWLTEILVEAYRVLKPGAHGLVWALPRTAHWTALALEDSGFEIRDNIVNHVNGQGFPKSLNVGKNIDKAAGAEREVVGTRGLHPWKTDNAGAAMKDDGGIRQDFDKVNALTAPATPEAEQWEGWGTALKPSQEIWWLVRKPLSENTVAANVLKWGTGALNIDASRISVSSEDAKAMERVNSPGSARLKASDGFQGASTFRRAAEDPLDTTQGRWPSNVMFSHVEGEPCPDCGGDNPACSTCQGTGEVGGCRRVGTKRVRGTSVPADKPTTALRLSAIRIEAEGQQKALFGQTVGCEMPVVGHADPDGKETVEAWECVPGCPVAQLDAQGGIRTSGKVLPGYRKNGLTQMFHGGYCGGYGNTALTGYGDSGNASRFYYCPKASSKERYFYCRTCEKVYSRKEIKVHLTHDLFQHPTQKPLDLMKYLVRMITPPRGTILDPFCGTGTTGVAARTQDFGFVGIDLDPDAIRVAAYRTEHDPDPDVAPMPAPAPAPAPVELPKKTLTLSSLFGGKGIGRQ